MRLNREHIEKVERLKKIISLYEDIKILKAKLSLVNAKIKAIQSKYDIVVYV